MAAIFIYAYQETKKYGDDVVVLAKYSYLSDGTKLSATDAAGDEFVGCTMCNHKATATLYNYTVWATKHLYSESKKRSRFV